MASNLAASGQSLLVIGQVLGHSQPRTTLRYVHFEEGRLQKAANAASAASGWNADIA
jgi:site-specific recombinase XerD